MLRIGRVSRAGPPTLEQILNRSMRVPASRASRVLRQLTPPPEGVPPIFPPKPAGEGGTGLSRGALAAEMKKEEAASREAEFVRPVARSRNTSQDLQSLLDAAATVGDWEGAAAAFADALRSPAFTPTPRQLAAVVAAAASEGATQHIEGPLMAALGSRPSAVAEETDASVVAPEAGVDSGADAAATDAAAVELIAAYAAADQWEPALRVLAHARAASTRPESLVSRAVTNAALQACERGERWHEALDIFSTMRTEAAVATPDAGPDSVTYATLMAVMEAAQRPDEARRVAADMPGREADEVLASYSALVQTWSARHARRAMKRF